MHVHDPSVAATMATTGTIQDVMSCWQRRTGHALAQRHNSLTSAIKQHGDRHAGSCTSTYNDRTYIGWGAVGAHVPCMTAAVSSAGTFTVSDASADVTLAVMDGMCDRTASYTS